MSEMETRKGHLQQVSEDGEPLYESAMYILKELCPDRYME